VNALKAFPTDRLRPLLRRRGFVLTLLAVAVLFVTAAGGELLAKRHDGTASSADAQFPVVADFIPIGQVPPQSPPPVVEPNASTGTFVSPCGRNENGHHNADNVIASPGKMHGAEHVHEYVGNVSTDGFSTDSSLAAAATTCRNGDLSTYYWPVLRAVTGDGEGTSGPAGWDGGPHNPGIRIPPAAVLVEFRGNPSSPVVAMPRFLRLVTGHPHAGATDPVTAGVAQWSCSGSPDRRTRLYPLCPAGQQVLRIYDFPSCWDGRRTDSPDHRSHTAFPTSDGRCPATTVAIPQVHLQVAYSVPPGRRFAIDTFPQQHRNPMTDHGDFINVMPDPLMAQVVACLNGGVHCGR
jgi:hypothetical protein